jgi:hypothetical protein
MILNRFFLNFLMENQPNSINNRKNALLFKFVIILILCMISTGASINYSFKIGQTYGILHVLFSYYPYPSFILNLPRIVIYVLTLISYKFLKVPWVESQDSIEAKRGRQIQITEDVDTFNELNLIIYRILEMSYYSGILPLGFISVCFFRN